MFIDALYFPYQNTIYEKSAAFANGQILLSAMEAEYDFNVAIVEHTSRELYRFLGAKHWRAVFYGIGGVVFIKDHISLPSYFKKPDKHRFDSLKNIIQTMGVVITAHNLNDLDTAAYVLSIMKRNMGHLYGYHASYNYLTAYQKGLEAYAQGDTDTAFNVFWGIGFTNRQLRINLYLRVML